MHAFSLWCSTRRAYMRNMADVLQGTWTAYPLQAHGFTPGFLCVVSVAHLFSALCFFVFCLGFIFVLFLYAQCCHCLGFIFVLFLYAQCCHCLCIVHSLLLLRFSLTFILCFNLGALFQQDTDNDFNEFGGLIYGYDNTKVRLWVPKQSGTLHNGKLNITQYCIISKYVALQYSFLAKKLSFKTKTTRSY